MIVSIIVAVDKNWGIGKDNQIPWYLSDDLKQFKNLTMGHHLIMGRKTYQSIGKPLPGRTTIVISRNRDYLIEDGFIVYSVDDAIQLAKSRGETEVFVIGGGEIYEQVIDIVDIIHLTEIDTDADCDVTFPNIKWEKWEEVESKQFEADCRNQFPFSYRKLQRTLT